MSAPGFHDVLRFDGSALRRAADAWAQLADRVERRADALLAAQQAATAGWQGPAAQRAGHRTRQLHTGVDATPGPLRELRNATADLADAGERLGIRARELTAEAAAAGVRIAPDGDVTAVAAAPAHAADVTGAFRREVAEVLAEASRIDAQAARRFADAAPWPPGRAHTYLPAAAVPDPGSDPHAVHRWWRSLDGAQRRYLLTTHPELLGGLDGVPVDARDRANQLLLERQRQRLTDRRAELQRQLRELPGRPGVRPGELDLTRELESVTGALAAMDAITRRRDRPASRGPRAYLLRFDPAGDGRAVLALGNPDRADHVLTYVPGTGSTLASVPGHLERAERMADDAARVAPEAGTAVVYWLDYDAPDDLLRALDRGYAADAGADLRRYAEGLRATHTGDGPHHTVLGHSYGSTVVGRTARDGLPADEVVFVGSPGVLAGSASELDIDRDPASHTWSTTAPSDPIRLARVPGGVAGMLAAPDGQRLSAPVHQPLVHGLGPSHPRFGAQTFDADPFSWHGGYWDEGNVAREHIAAIAVGDHPGGGRS